VKKIIIIMVAVLLIPIALSMATLANVHAASVSGTFTGTSQILNTSKDASGNTVTLSEATIVYSGPLSGKSTSTEIDVTYPNGTGQIHGTETIVGSLDGGGTGSVAGIYTGSFTATGIHQSTESLNRGNYGLQGLQAQGVWTEQIVSCNSQGTICSLAGNYTLTSIAYQN